MIKFKRTTIIYIQGGQLMKNAKLCLSVCVVFLFTTLLGSLAFAQEGSETYYHYDLKIDEFRSLPFKSYKVNNKLPRNYIDKNDVVTRKNLLKTSYYDENYPAVMVESSYKIVDIVEIEKNIYIVAEREDEIIKVFDKKEFEQFEDSFNTMGIYLSYMPKNYDSFDEIFKIKGIKSSLNQKSKKTISFFNDYIDSLQLSGYTQGDLYFSGYETEIGNVVTGKYLVNQKNLEQSNPEFCKLISENDTGIHKLNENSLKVLRKYSSFYGDDFKPVVDLLRSSNYFQYEKNQDLSFKSQFDFDKFLQENGISSKLKIDSFADRTFRLYKTLEVRDNGSIKSQETLIKDVTDDLKTTEAPYQVIDQAIDYYGARVYFASPYIVVNTVSNFNPNIYATKDGKKVLINKYGVLDISEGISNIKGSIIYEKYDKNRTVSLAEKALNTMSDYQLALIGIQKQKRSAMPIKDSAFYDLFAGYYISDKYTLSLQAASDYILSLGQLDKPEYEQLFKGYDSIIANGKDYVTRKSIDKDKHITYYTYESGLRIDSYPWGFEMKDKYDAGKGVIFYKMPKYKSYLVNPFTNPEQYTRENYIAYWDLKDYYKGEVAFVAVKKGVSTVENYKLLEGNENFSTESSTVHHKAKRLKDNKIINIDLSFEDERIMVSSY